MTETVVNGHPDLTQASLPEYKGQEDLLVPLPSVLKIINDFEVMTIEQRTKLIERFRNLEDQLGPTEAIPHRPTLSQIDNIEQKLAIKVESDREIPERLEDIGLELEEIKDKTNIMEERLGIEGVQSNALAERLGDITDRLESLRLNGRSPIELINELIRNRYLIDPDLLPAIERASLRNLLQLDFGIDTERLFD